MKTYFVKCRRDTENIDPKMVRTKKNRLIMQSKCLVCRINRTSKCSGSCNNINDPYAKLCVPVQSF